MSKSRQVCHNLYLSIQVEFILEEKFRDVFWTMFLIYVEHGPKYVYEFFFQDEFNLPIF